MLSKKTYKGIQYTYKKYMLLCYIIKMHVVYIVSIFVLEFRPCIVKYYINIV